MKDSIEAVEKIIGYKFKNKKLIEEALTHPSAVNGSISSYERLEFLGDSALGLAFSNYFFRTHPDLLPSQLHELRAANVSNENFARVAIRHDLYQYVRKYNTSVLDDKVKKYEEEVRKEEKYDGYKISGDPPKVLADIVESLASAVFVDVDHDIQRFWKIFKGFLEPIVTLKDLDNGKKVQNTPQMKVVVDLLESDETKGPKPNYFPSMGLIIFLGLIFLQMILEMLASKLEFPIMP